MGRSSHERTIVTASEMDLDFAKLKEVSLGAAVLDDPDYFVLPPLPNSLFTRDSSCWIFGGVSVNPAAGRSASRSKRC